MHKPTFHLDTVATVADLPKPVAEARALVTGEKTVYVAEEIDGELQWVVSKVFG